MRSLILVITIIHFLDSVIQNISEEDADNDSPPTKGLRAIKRFYHNGSQSQTINRSKAIESDSTKAPPEKPPVIFYCTRTHKQIKQIVSEMKKCHAAKTTK